MPRISAVSAVSLVIGLLLGLHAASAAGKKAAPKTDAGAPAVEKVLRAEVAGPVDRREKLAGTLKELPDSPSTRWQAGFVRDGDEWRSFEETPATTAANAAVLAEYQSRRRDTSDAFAAQLSLADWCRKQGLVDQERAHLNAALPSAPADQLDPIRRRLGWRQMGGVWFSREDLLEWQKLNRSTEQSLKRWETRLNRIASGLSGSSRQREAAFSALKEIKDPGAVPALELILSGNSEAAAVAAIDVMRRIESPQSSLALAKQAVFSQWPEARHSAAQSLKSRRLEEFVPPVLSLLATPVKSELRVTVQLRGSGNSQSQFVFLASSVLHRETGDQFQVAAFHTANFQINEALNGTRIRRGSEFGQATQVPGFVRGANDALRSTAAQEGDQQRAIEQVNAQTAELNERIGSLLAVVSGNDPSSDPHVWWDWWTTHSDTPPAGEKPTTIVTEEYFVGNPQSSFQTYDCLAAGTPVWTDRGLLAIETISVGDRVLSQDVDTGELAYKPVLRTTVRPPKELWTVRFDQESVVLTGGHRFWSSGSGWVKARDLAAQTLVHTVTGNTPVWTAKKGESAQTYNLVVADFHTYFIGKSGILSQDVLTPRGTNSLVPGLARTNAAAEGK